MDTPIYDFAHRYAAANPVRCHTPGHKGCSPLSGELQSSMPLDITEIAGADSLYAANGIIAQSEANATALFGTGATFYSTEGSSQCIRAMLFLARMRTNTGQAQRPVIVAGRNAHSAFLQAAALLDFDIVWLWPEAEPFSLCSCPISPAGLRRTLESLPHAPTAVFVTSPDYLGAMLDIGALADICRHFGTPLLVDNAHGAYLRFLPGFAHPMVAGADLCCDSAHKTLPVLTGGAYLHIHKTAPETFAQNARRALSMFGSTSPSYLILQSLDLANRTLAEGFTDRLTRCTAQIADLKRDLQALGWQIHPSDPLRITVRAMESGYLGEELSALLRQGNIACEYAQAEHLVLLFSSENTPEDAAQILQAFRSISVKSPLPMSRLSLAPPRVHCSVRQALFSPRETIATAAAMGRVLCAATVSCPPAVPVVVGGEILAEDAVEILLHYGIDRVDVICETE